MANIPKAGIPSPCSPKPPSSEYAATSPSNDTIMPGDSVYMNPDGNIYRCGLATAAGATVRVRGQSAGISYVGTPCTPTRGQLFWWGSPGQLVIGTDYYLSATVQGGLDDAPGYTGAPVIAFAVTDQIVQFLHAN